MKFPRRGVAPLVGVVRLGGAVAGCVATEESGGSSASSGSTDGSKAACVNRASDGCTPHVAMGHQVRVDALDWEMTTVKTAESMGDTEYGLDDKADGRFVIVDLNVGSDRDESATLTDEIVQLEIDGNTYKPDSDGTIAAIGSGADPLWFDDIGPDATMRGKVVFDVPPSALSKQISVRLGELGFGTTKGCIDLPQAAL